MTTMSITLRGKLDAGEYGTYPITLASSFSPYSDTSLPSTMTLPPEGVSSLLRQCRKVDLPTPFGPIMDTTSPSPNLRETDSRTLLSL